MAKKEGALFEYGSGSEYINSVLSGERLSNNLKALARTIAGRKIKQMKSQDKDISTAKAKRAVKDAIAEAKKNQNTSTTSTSTKPKTTPKPKTTTTKSTNPGRPGGESGTRTASKPKPKTKTASSNLSRDISTSRAKRAAKDAVSDAKEPRTIAQAKRMGKSYFIGKDGKKKAAVTAEELQASGHKNLTAYLNAKGKKAKK